MTLAITGHGHFRCDLNSYNLVEGEICAGCGVIETHVRVIFKCERYLVHRTEVKALLESLGRSFEEKEMAEKEGMISK